MLNEKLKDLDLPLLLYHALVKILVKILYDLA